MKRLTLIISVITLSVVIGFSQNTAHTKTMEEVKQYIDDNVFPTIEKQQTSYLSKLTEAEKTELSIIINTKSERNGNNSGKQNNRSSKNSNGNRNSKIENGSMSEVEKITNSHPNLNKSYTEVIDKNKQIWIDDINEMHKKNGSEPMHSKDGKMGIEMYFTRIGNPNWLLLWDPSKPRMVNHNRNQNQKKANLHRSAINKTSLTPELKADIKSYTNKNIIPVISKERTEFDNLLSTDEKKVIEETRQKIEVRKIMFKNWYESDDFEAGKRAKNPNFDNMRTDMQKSMVKVREIATNHSTEISESISNIRSHTSEWQKEISAISERNNQDPEVSTKIIRAKLRKSQTPVSFLLFNPNKSKD